MSDKTKTETETKKPVVDPKRNVQVIDVDHLEDVIGGNAAEPGFHLRMSAQEEA